MAETGFNTRSVPVAGVAEARDFQSDQTRETARRVEPVEKQDASASLTDDQHEEDRTANIERLASDAFANSRLKILQDDTSGQYIYLMIDQDTGETIRRWPPETHADLLEYLRTRTAGLIDRIA